MLNVTNQNPCLHCNADRQEGNPYRWQCECDRCEKRERWRQSMIDRAVELEGILGPEYDMSRLFTLIQADREGRCIVTPYRIPGDAYINHDDVTLYKRMLGGEMTEIEVSELYVSEDGICDFEPVGEGHDGVVYGIGDMGITIFTEPED